MKAILIIEMPENCKECPLRSYDDLELICTPMRREADEESCPLIPFWGLKDESED